MSWRTTAVLFVILVLLGGYVYYQSQQEPAETPTPTPGPPTPERVPLITDATIDEVNQLDVVRLEDDARSSFFRDALGNWQRTVPTTTLVISQTMNTQVTGLINLQSNRTLPADLNPLSAYGLDEPDYEISLTVMRDEQSDTFTFLVGNETPAGEAFYLQKEGDSRVHIAPLGPIQNMINLIDNPPIPQPTATPELILTPPLSGTLELTVTPALTGTLIPTPDE